MISYLVTLLLHRQRHNPYSTKKTLEKPTIEPNNEKNRVWAQEDLSKQIKAKSPLNVGNKCIENIKRKN